MQLPERKGWSLTPKKMYFATPENMLLWPTFVLDTQILLPFLKSNLHHLDPPNVNV